MFCNVMTNVYTNDAVEQKNGDWYIKVGFSGYNSAKNNGFGYETKKKAEAAILRYQSKFGF